MNMPKAPKVRNMLSFRKYIASSFQTIDMNQNSIQEWQLHMLISNQTQGRHVTWMNTRKTECVYRSSGKTPLLVNHRQPYFSWILNPLLPTLSLPCWIFLHHYLVTTISMDKHELKLDFKRFWEEFRSSSSEKEKEALVSYHVIFIYMDMNNENVGMICSKFVEHL
ncbi:hypothetical protein HN51_036333 [Arachis hypogaea]